MCQSKVLLGLGWILCFTSFASFMVEAGLLTERKVRQDTLSRICEDGCSPGQQVNEDCCKGSKCTESEYCQDCVGETYSKGGRHDICQSCTICPANADELQKCTKERDAQCQCMLNYFKSPSEQCLHCNTCTGEAYCKDVCSSTPPPNNPGTTTNQPSTTTGTGVSTITPPTSVTPTSVGMITSSSSVFSTAVPQVDPETKRCIEKLECIIPVIIVVILVILIITIISWSYCLSQECKEFLAGCFPCCHGFRSFEGSSPRNIRLNESGVNQSLPSSDANGNGEVSRTNGENVPLKIIASNQHNPDETKPLMRHPDSNKSGAERSDPKDDSLKLTFRTSIRRRSSLQVVPEHGFLSAVSNVKFVLPDWCSMDATRVTIEIISKISGLIGNKVASVGALLGLHIGEVETIEHDHKNNLQRQNYEVLLLWVQRQGILATKKRLAQVLVEIGRVEDTFQYLWPERELEPVTPTTPTDYFWKRRKSDSSNFNFDTTVLRKKDWTKDSTWRNITQNLRESDSGKFDELIGACHVLRSKLPKFAVLEKCQSASGNSDLETDHYANSLTDSDRQGLTAMKVSADDNCLFSAGSIVAVGSANRCCELRLRTVIELCCEKDYYLKQEALIKCMKAEYELTKTEDDDILSDDAIPAVFEGCVRDTLKELFSLHGNPIQMFGLASVLGCNIQSIYPTMGDTEQSPLHVLIPPRNKDIKNPITSYLMWSIHTELGEDEVFHPNHFVPLLEK